MSENQDPFKKFIENDLDGLTDMQIEERTLMLQARVNIKAHDIDLGDGLDYWESSFDPRSWDAIETIAKRLTLRLIKVFKDKENLDDLKINIYIVAYLWQMLFHFYQGQSDAEENNP